MVQTGAVLDEKTFYISSKQWSGKYGGGLLTWAACRNLVLYIRDQWVSGVRWGQMKCRIYNLIRHLLPAKASNNIWINPSTLIRCKLVACDVQSTSHKTLIWNKHLALICINGDLTVAHPIRSRQRLEANRPMSLVRLCRLGPLLTFTSSTSTCNAWYRLLRIWDVRVELFVDDAKQLVQGYYNQYRGLRSALFNHRATFLLH